MSSKHVCPSTAGTECPRMRMARAAKDLTVDMLLVLGTLEGGNGGNQDSTDDAAGQMETQNIGVW